MISIAGPRSKLALPSRWTRIAISLLAAGVILAVAVASYEVAANRFGFFVALGEAKRYSCEGHVYALRFVGSVQSFASATVNPDRLFLWDTNNGNRSQLAYGGCAIDVSENGKWLVAGNYRGEVTLMQLPAGRVARQWRLPKGSALGVAISGDGSRVYVAQGPDWDGKSTTGLPLEEYHFWSLSADSSEIGDPSAGFQAPVRAIDASSDGTIIGIRTSESSLWIWSNDAKAFLVRPKMEKDLGSTQLIWGMIGGVKVTPDGKYVQCGYEIRNTQDGTEHNLYVTGQKLFGRDEAGQPGCCDLSNDGRRAAYGSIGTAWVVEVESKHILWSKQVNQSGTGVIATAFSPDDKYLLTGCRPSRGYFSGTDPKRGATRISDEHIRLWKLE